jgi:Kdo2-lipid IVA lauroyltransferase/acyltransferase
MPIWYSAAAGSNKLLGLSQKKNRLRIWTEYALAQALMEALRWLPLPLSNASARAAMRILDRIAPRLRRVALTNLSFALPECGPGEHARIVDGVFQSIARMLVSMARFPALNSANISEWIAYEGLEYYQAAKQQGRGVLIATAHLGNWELSAFAHALMTEPMHVIVRPLDNRSIDRLIETRRTLSGNHLIDKRDAARSVIKALRYNEAVGILIDQNTSAAEGIFIDFFGKLACAGSGFVKLAHHSQAPVIPGFALWNFATDRYLLRFYPPIEITGDISADTQRLHSAIEAVIREYPGQWMWIHRRWKTRPEGEPPLY